MKFKNHNKLETFENEELETKVKLTDLLLRLNQEKKQERRSNFLLSIAAVSAVSVFGIILSL